MCQVHSWGHVGFGTLDRVGRGSGVESRAAVTGALRELSRYAERLWLVASQIGLICYLPRVSLLATCLGQSGLICDLYRISPLGTSHFSRLIR